MEELSMEEKARIVNNEMCKAWRKKNPERYKEIQMRYRAKKYDKMMAEKAAANKKQGGN